MQKQCLQSVTSTCAPSECCSRHRLQTWSMLVAGCHAAQRCRLPGLMMHHSRDRRQLS